MKKQFNIFFVVIVMVIFFSVSPLFASAMVTYPMANSWTTKAALPEARAGVGTAVVNDKIYAIGGSASTFNEEYDPATNMWTTKAPLPIPTGYFAIASYQNKIYCFGGITGPSDSGYTLTAVNQVYDTITNKWETKASMPTAKCYLQANVVNGKIYLIGGNDEFGFTLTNEVMVYDPETNVWSKGASIPTTVASYVSGIFDNKICVVTSSLFQLYDSEKDSWSLGKSPPMLGSISCGGVTSGLFALQRIYIFGEKGSANYDSKTETWTRSASLPTYRSYPSVALLNDSFYVIGGYTTQAAIEPSSNLPTYFQPHTTLSAVNEQYMPLGYGTPDPSITPPKVIVLSPENTNYNSSSVTLVFNVDKPVNWMEYSLDGYENITVNGNLTLTGLSNGVRNITVYANDTFGNIGASQTISFSVTKPATFPIATVATFSGASAAVVVAGLVIYVKKHKQ